jgi:hypothetical protein
MRTVGLTSIENVLAVSRHEPLAPVTKHKYEIDLPVARQPDEFLRQRLVKQDGLVNKPFRRNDNGMSVGTRSFRKAVPKTAKAQIPDQLFLQEEVPWVTWTAHQVRIENAEVFQEPAAVRPKKRLDCA